MSRFLLVAVAVLAFLPGRAGAHDLRAVVKLPPDGLVVEAGFDDDTPAEGAKVTVTDAAGAVVAEGKTDDTGVCKFPKPGPGKYTAVVESVGHRDTIEFEVSGGSVFDEYRGWRPNQTLGLAIGVGGLLAVSLGYWWFRRKSCCREKT